MACLLCGDESVTRERAAMNDPLLLMVVEVTHADYMAHLRLAHPQEYAREHAQELEMNAALASVFGGRRQR